MMLDLCRKSLRITNKHYDDEIQSLIDSAKNDIEQTGITLDSDSPIIKQAVMLYVKSNFGYDNKDSDRQQERYQMLLRKLAVLEGVEDENK